MGRGNLRKRKAEDAEDEGAGEGAAEEDADTLKKLADIKAAQRLRQRANGLSAEDLVEGRVVEAAQRTAAGGGANELKEAFYAEQNNDTGEDPSMLKYIEEKLAQKRGARAPEADAAAGGGKRPDGKLTEDDLFEAPDRLKLEKVDAKDEADRWLTGIIEVQLPVAFRVKNVEETELAKKRMLEETRLRAEREARERAGVYTLEPEQERTKVPRSCFAARFGRSGAKFTRPMDKK